jgi:hypothetical protein
MSLNTIPGDVLESIARFLSARDIVHMSMISQNTLQAMSTVLESVKIDVYIEFDHHKIPAICQVFERFTHSHIHVESVVDWNGVMCYIKPMYLRRIVELNLSYCDISDVSMLGHIRGLNLKGCKNITDVSALGCVRQLDLNVCLAVIDVSALGKNKQVIYPTYLFWK